MKTPEQTLNDGLHFLEAIDALKDTYRQCLIMSGERNESTAEHSFSLAMAVLTFGALSSKPIDLIKTVKMALFHDLPEALVGDVFHYDKASSQKEVSESEALKKLLQPIVGTSLAEEISLLWHEFEFGQTNEAIFLRGLDRFLPMYHNFKTKGHSWLKHGVTQEMALSKNAHIKDSSAELWAYTKNMLDQSKQNGWLK